MRFDQADLMDNVLAWAAKERGSDELNEVAGLQESIPVPIEEICNGEWSIGGS